MPSQINEQIGVPLKFRRHSAVNINFDWIDYVNNAGYLKFYGIYATQVTGSGYYLTTQVLDAPTLGAVAVGTSGCYGYGTEFNVGAGITEINFDLTFQIPMVLATSTAFVQATKHLLADSNNNTLAYTIYHVTPAGVETSLGTATSKATTGDGSWYVRDYVQITTTEKAFAVGDRIRLEIVSNCEDDFDLYHDPASLKTFVDIVGRTVGTDLFIMLPFKLQK